MGMISEGDAFAAMVRSGEMVWVGTDQSGQPLYSHISCFSKPFTWATPELSRILYAIVRLKLPARQ